jgi:hypothetical protein
MFMNFDLSKIEERVLGNLCASNAPDSAFPNKLWEYAAQLPKKHPFRFALLYSAGPATAARMTAACASEAERRVHLEAEIQCFETWQRGENPEESLLEKMDRMFPAVKKADSFMRIPMKTECTITGRWTKPYEPFHFGAPYGMGATKLFEKFKEQIAANDGTALFDTIIDIEKK